MENIQQLTALGQCFSEPIRVRILSLLIRKQRICMSDLQSTIGITQTACSRHLKHLREYGLVDVTVKDNYRYYSVKPAMQLEVLTLISYCEDPLLAADSALYNKLKQANFLQGASIDLELTF
jgi:ArsR family transcriptional regulator, arsenate/arsenite/antimonite-responsive transcriptional repressor